MDGTAAPADVVGRADLLGALCPYQQPSATGICQEDRFLLLQAKMCDEPSSSEAGPGCAVPYRCPTTGWVVAWWGRLDNAADLVRELGLPAARHSEEELVLAAFRRWGLSCAARLVGDFVGAIYEPGRRRVWLVRDRLGVKPLYYRLTAQSLVFATTGAVFARLRPPADGVNREWMARYLTDIPTDATATGWADVVRLAPGHWLEVVGGTDRLERYHRWRDDPPWTTRRDPSRVEEYRAALEEAIRCRMPISGNIGTESSGGLDSSTITSYLAHFLGESRDQLCAIGSAMAELEAEYITETSRHAGISHNYLLTTRRHLSDASIARCIAAVGHPEANGVLQLDFYEECQRRGIRTLFSGFGGDETVTNSGRLLPRELRDHRAYRALWSQLPGGYRIRCRSMAGAVAKGARWGAGHPELQAAMDARWPWQLVRADVAHDLGLPALHAREAAYDAPYRRINDFILHNRFPYLAPRLEGCTLVAATYGVEHRWPLLDARLIQQYLSTPSIEKASREFRRYLHRCAVDAVVAPKVAWKPTKDMGAMPEFEPLGDGGDDNPVVREARRQRAHLHPAVEEIIDARRLDDQIAAASRGPLEGALQFQFHQNVDHLRWLNHWLWGGAPPP